MPSPTGLPKPEPSGSELQKVGTWIRLRAFENQMQHRTEANEFNALGPPIWKVHARCEVLRFFEQADAIAWAKSNNISQGNIREEEHRYIKPSTVDWLNQQFSKGMEVQNPQDLIARVQKRNLDDAVRWFNNLTWASPTVAHALLNVAFSANRSDALACLVQWAHKNPYAWFDENSMAGSSTTFGPTPKDCYSRCLFSLLIKTPSMLRWFLDNAPELKAPFLQSKQWDLVTNAALSSPPELQAWWPAVAYGVFGKELSPLQFEKVWQKPFHTEQLHASFEHAPAAQSTIAYWRTKKGAWDKKIHYSSNNEDVSAFYAQLRAMHKQEAWQNLPTTPLVNQLMVGVHLDLSPEDFYVHAQNVFRPSLFPEENLPNIDSNVFA